MAREAIRALPPRVDRDMLRDPAMSQRKAAYWTGR
jgi:hypothetical protein